MIINNTLREYKNKKPIRFHMPGNKGNKEFTRFFKDLASIDITELGFSDNLLDAKGIIKESEKEYAKSIGVKKCIYSTCGSTISNYSILRCFSKQTICYEGNAHRSVENACELFDIKGIKIPNNKGTDGRNIPITANQIEDTLKKNKAIKAVMITYPDYFGSCGDIKTISNVCKKYKKYLIADSAHGAHLFYSDILPAAPSKYADAFVISTHKTLPSLTGGSVICINNSTLAPQIEENFKKIHSTSPSYPIMASIEYANDYMIKYCDKKIREIYETLKKFDSIIAGSNYERVMVDDFTRLIILCKKDDGIETEAILRKNNIYIEIFDKRFLVLVLSVMDNKKDLIKLARILKKT